MNSCQLKRHSHWCLDPPNPSPSNFLRQNSASSLFQRMNLQQQKPQEISKFPFPQAFGLGFLNSVTWNVYTPLNFNIDPEKCWFEDSGSMLNFGGIRWISRSVGATQLTKEQQKVREFRESWGCPCEAVLRESLAV